MGQEHSCSQCPARGGLRTAGPAGVGAPEEAVPVPGSLDLHPRCAGGERTGLEVAGTQRLGLATPALPSATGSDRDPPRQHCLRRHFRWAGLGVGNGPQAVASESLAHPTGRAFASLHPAPSSHGSLSGLQSHL